VSEFGREPKDLCAQIVLEKANFGLILADNA